jgi:hypothetical protein
MPNTMASSVPTNRAVVLSSSNTNGCVPEVEHVSDQNIQKRALSGKDYNLLNSHHLMHLRFTVDLLLFNIIWFRFSALSEIYMKLYLLLSERIYISHFQVLTVMGYVHGQNLSIIY